MSMSPCPCFRFAMKFLIWEQPRLFLLSAGRRLNIRDTSSIVSSFCILWGDSDCSPWKSSLNQIIRLSLWGGLEVRAAALISDYMFNFNLQHKTINRDLSIQHKLRRSRLKSQPLLGKIVTCLGYSNRLHKKTSVSIVWAKEYCIYD